jgi:UrcA family protein
MNIQSCKTPPIASVKFFTAIAAVLLVLATAATALTPIRVRADDFSPRSVRVSLHNLNLNSAEGARKAYGRLKEAAFSVCGESSEDIEVIVRGPGECVKETLARAVLDVQSAELSKLYIKRNGIGLATLYGVASPIVTAGNVK